MIDPIISVILTSSVVSAVVTIVLEVIFKTRIEHNYQLQLERLKTELSIVSKRRERIDDARFEIYPAVAEIVYRVRNLARDIVSSKELPDESGNAKLDELNNSLEESLFKHRIDLERDELFLLIHQYKNNLKSFRLTLLSNNTNEKRRELVQTYELINASYERIVHRLLIATATPIEK